MNVDNGNRSRIKMNNQSNLHTEICRTLYQTSNTSIHCLMEPSSTQWDRYDHSSIHLGGASVDSTYPRNPKVLYSTVKYGANIKLTKKVQCLMVV